MEDREEEIFFSGVDNVIKEEDFSLITLNILRVLTLISIFFSIVYLYSYSKHDYNLYLILPLCYISLIVLNVIYVVFPHSIGVLIAISFTKIEAFTLMILLFHGWYTIHFDSYYNLNSILNSLILFIIDIKVNCYFFENTIIRIIINIFALFLYYTLMLLLSMKTYQILLYHSRCYYYQSGPSWSLP